MTIRSVIANHVKMKKVGAASVLIFAIALLTVVITRRCERNKIYIVNPITLQVDSLDQIELIRDSLVKPLLYTHVTGLEKLPVSESKDAFVSVMLPSILVAKHQVDYNKIKTEQLIKKKRWRSADSTFYLNLMKRYKANDHTDLLDRMITLPNSIVLAQAAVESGWGQSRFFLEGNNVFGIWSFNINEPRIQAGVARESSHVYLRAYENISQSVSDYFETLGSVRAYTSLRNACKETDDPFELLIHLKYYSERRELYVNQIRSVIQQNNLTQFDHHRIDPKYISAE